MCIMFSKKSLIVFTLYFLQAIHANNGTYGEDWVWFIDEEGGRHFLNLNISEDEIELLEKTRRVDRSSAPKFYHYTRETAPLELSLPLQEDISNIITGAPLILVSGGWLSRHEGLSTKLIKDALLNMDDNVNVITVDWYDMQSYNYIYTASITLQVAEIVSECVKQVSKLGQIDGSNIHLIGFSLGAHVVGLTGEKLRAQDINVGRVTGLDPARPFFEWPKRYPGLSINAATFVDVIHTSASFLGIYNPVGHASFYPGGGKHQPALCPTSCFCMGICEHSAAYKYFAKSIFQLFEARLCESYELFKSGQCDHNEMQYMGYPCKSSARGKYYLDIDYLNP